MTRAEAPTHSPKIMQALNEAARPPPHTRMHACMQCTHTRTSCAGPAYTTRPSCRSTRSSYIDLHHGVRRMGRWYRWGLGLPPPHTQKALAYDVKHSAPNPAMRPADEPQQTSPGKPSAHTRRRQGSKGGGTHHMEERGWWMEATTVWPAAANEDSVRMTCGRGGEGEERAKVCTQ